MTTSESDDLTASESAAFRGLANKERRDIFFALFWCYLILLRWGFKVQTVIHQCPCPDRGADEEAHKQCPFNGRQLIRLASGLANDFSKELRSLCPECCDNAIQALNQLAADVAATIRQAFQHAKQKMLLRFDQGTRYYSEYPWNIVRLLQYVLVPAEKRLAAVKQSQAFARELLNDHRQGHFPKTFADMFFSGSLGYSLEEWCKGVSTVMGNTLFKKLLSYGLALVVMQRLESRHHLVSLKVGQGRAITAAAVSANLRRKLNNDTKQDSFKQNFSQYLERFEELVPETWTTMRELHQLVSGHHLSLMFSDIEREDAIIKAKAAETKRTTPAEILLYQEHTKAVLREGCIYAVAETIDRDETVYDILQIVSFQPGNKKYMQRVVGWSSDAWTEKMAVVRLGHVRSHHRDDATQQVCVLDRDYTTVVKPGLVEAVPISTLFKFDFEHIYQFQVVEPFCDFDLEAVECALEDMQAEEKQDTFQPLDIATSPTLLWLIMCQSNLV